MIEKKNYMFENIVQLSTFTSGILLLVSNIALQTPKELERGETRVKLET